jgi:Transposase, Mutator family
VAVVVECYVRGVSTRRVEGLVATLGIQSLSKSQVSELAKTLDAEVAAFRSRLLDAGPYAYVWMDALAVKCREGGRIVNIAGVVATGVGADGHREILGVDVLTSEDGAGWTSFLRDLVARGLSVLLGQHRADQPHHRRPVGEDAHNIGAPPQFLVQPLLRIVGPDLAPVLLGERGECQQLVGRISQQLGCLGKAFGELLDDAGVLRPGGRVSARCAFGWIVGCEDRSGRRQAGHRHGRPFHPGHCLAPAVRPQRPL